MHSLTKTISFCDCGSDYIFIQHMKCSLCDQVPSPSPHPTELFRSLTPKCTPQLRYENSRLMFLLALEIFNHLIFIWNIMPFFVHCTEKITFTQSCKWNSRCKVIVVSQVERGIFFIPNVILAMLLSLSPPAYRSQSPACPSPVFGRSGSTGGLLRPLSWPAGKPSKSPGDPADSDENQSTRRQLSDPLAKPQFQSLATDVNG